MLKKDYTGRLSLRHQVSLILFLAVCILLGLSAGRMWIPPVEALHSLGAKLNLMTQDNPQIDTVIWNIRVPRVLLAALVGAGLSVCGCTFQNLFSNPLATPDTLGVASGASFGAALGLLLGMHILGVQFTALLFGLLAVAITAISSHGIGNSKNTPILAGIMVSSLFSSLVSLIKYTANTETQLPAITYWLMGSMEGAGYKTMAFGAPPILFCVGILWALRWKMNLLPLSEEEAISSGVNIKALRIIVELCATMITASCVSMCGQVGWVGLLVPHMCRMMFRSNTVSLLPASAFLGAGFLILVDTLARTASPREIPISIITALIGAPFFIYLLRKNRGWNL